MQLIRGLHQMQHAALRCVATIGNFDGMHLGHQAVIAGLCQHAKRLQVPSCVVLFEPQPREFFDPAHAPARLTNLAEKIRLLTDTGVDRVLCLPFNRRLQSLSAAEFVADILVAGLGVVHLEIGDDFRFGCDRLGDFAFLQAAGSRHQFSVVRAQSLLVEGLRVSSTAIRQALAAADFVQAQRLLGRPYSITGRVLYGQALGRQLGVPTANIQLKRHKIALKGVYLVQVPVDGVLHNGIANIGTRPSVRGNGSTHLEVHLLDFSGDLYHHRLSVRVQHKLRDEQRFDSLTALKAAIHADLAAARSYWQTTPSLQRVCS